VERGCADQQIRERNRKAKLPRLCIDLGRELGHLPGERFHRDRRENAVQILAPLPCLLRGLGAMQSVLQFNHGDGREHDFSFAVFVFECGQQAAHWPGFTLSGNQNA
jgi:hypothetical protein